MLVFLLHIGHLICSSNYEFSSRYFCHYLLGQTPRTRTYIKNDVHDLAILNVLCHKFKIFDKNLIRMPIAKPAERPLYFLCRPFLTHLYIEIKVQLDF